jgi:hypothetical protein
VQGHRLSPPYNWPLQYRETVLASPRAFQHATTCRSQAQGYGLENGVTIPGLPRAIFLSWRTLHARKISSSTTSQKTNIDRNGQAVLLCYGLLLDIPPPLPEPLPQLLCRSLQFCPTGLEPL